MLLSDVLSCEEYKTIAGDANTCEVTRVEYDSRKACKGSLFVAVIGFETDGHKYIKSAIELGASAIICSGARTILTEDELVSLAEGRDVTIVEMSDTRRALASASSAILGHPERKLDIYGITGTKGKTTSTFMLKQIFDKAGISSGLIGTVCNLIGDKKIHSEHTTPESRDLYDMLGELTDSGAESLVMEVSSQGLKLDRVYGISYKCACFTNLYKDHIAPSEHPDMEDYFNCKLKIFDNCDIGIVNIDSDKAQEVIEYCKDKCKVLTYGLKEGSDIRATDLTKVRKGHVTGTSFTIVSPVYNGEVFVALPGEFNVHNALCAIACAMQAGIPFEDVLEALAECSVPGRLQSVANDKGISILVDYAHNAAALESVLKTLREYTGGRIITVFGCGGDRSKDRRFEMGEVSGNLSDHTVITTDNPRTEDPMAIIDNIVTGISRTKGSFEIVEDRTSAIKRAIEIAGEGDTVLIAGKGHEDYQIFGKTKTHFDDYETALKIAEGRI
ncbi:MAG: UDP-N-acetylmuramoyl-L-alanyl-D-glutamate--2,6-diaminopimelate ligase [Saccharofermentans sp.]|nr:UDP-N-acetylmuramoyl-L-alanyl-D-glutamate--2,6-diaminopimelate ligase [Saccharofermentans sp.]